jgi:hypothetical protein
MARELSTRWLLALAPIAVMLGCGAAPSRTSPEAPPVSPAPALTLRSTETHATILELDSDGTVRVGTCSVGALRARRFEGATGETLDFTGGSARLADERVLVWTGDRVELRTPTGVLSVMVDTNGAVIGTNSAGGHGSGARYDAMPPGASETALMLAAVYFFVGRAPCEPPEPEVPDYL